MNEQIKNGIRKRVEIIINEFSFENRRYEHPEECPCNHSGACHLIDDLNCFFCYCPWYETSNPEGGCKIENPLGKGKWFYRPGNEISNRIWDCSDCVYPHKEEVIRTILTKLFAGDLNPQNENGK